MKEKIKKISLNKQILNKFIYSAFLFVAGFMFASFISTFLMLPFILFGKEDLSVLIVFLGTIIGTPIMIFKIKRAIEKEEGFIYEWFMKEKDEHENLL